VDVCYLLGLAVQPPGGSSEPNRPGTRQEPVGWPSRCGVVPAQAAGSRWRLPSCRPPGS